MFSCFSLLKVAESATSKKELFILFTFYAHCILMSFYTYLQVIPHFGFDGRILVLIIFVLYNYMTVMFVCFVFSFIQNKTVSMSLFQTKTDK